MVSNVGRQQKLYIRREWYVLNVPNHSRQDVQWGYSEL